MLEHAWEVRERDTAGAQQAVVIHEGNTNVTDTRASNVVEEPLSFCAHAGILRETWEQWPLMTVGPAATDRSDSRGMIVFTNRSRERPHASAPSWSVYQSGRRVRPISPPVLRALHPSRSSPLRRMERMGWQTAGGSRAATSSRCPSVP